MKRRIPKEVTPSARYRTQRLKIAFALEGPGAASRMASEWNVSVTLLYHVASTKTRHSSFRLETLIDAYVRETFAKHRAVLDLEAA